MPDRPHRAGVPPRPARSSGPLRYRDRPESGGRATDRRCPACRRRSRRIDTVRPRLSRATSRSLRPRLRPPCRVACQALPSTPRANDGPSNYRRPPAPARPEARAPARGKHRPKPSACPTAGRTKTSNPCPTCSRTRSGRPCFPPGVCRSPGRARFRRSAGWSIHRSG